MIFKLTRKEYVRLMSSTLMYSAVNMEGFLKPDLEGDHKEQFDKLDTKLFELVEATQGLSNEQQLELKITQDDLDMLIRIIEADMKACGDGITDYSISDYRIHFNSERKDVAELLAKLRAYQASSMGS